MTSYYKTIDELPIWHFNKIIETNDLTYLVKKGKVDNLVGIVWEEILEQFTEYVGFSESYKDYMRYSKKSALLVCEAYLENAFFKLNLARIAKRQAEESLQEEEKDFLKTVVLLSKHQGYRIDTKVVSVKEFYAIFKTLENGKQKDKE